MSANPMPAPTVVAPIRRPIVYPESDGLPMADNSKQAEWIVLLFTNLQALLRDEPNAFVAANNLWYPVEGEPSISAAPDVYVVFGRPRGDRGSYQQWNENNVPLTVVFEILSPSNDHMEMAEKFHFYEEHGVEEYYVYDPSRNKLLAYRRLTSTLVGQRPIHGYRSPRLGISFDLSGTELVVRYPDGRPFARFEEESKRADQAERSLARLRELSRKARLGSATPDELAELERLEQG